VGVVSKKWGWLATPSTLLDQPLYHGTEDYRRMQFPRFLGKFGACAVSVNQALFLLFPREPGNEAM